MVLKTYSAFYSHIKRYHNYCSISNKNDTNHFSENQHLFKCPLENCNFITYLVQDYKRHFYTHLSEGKSFRCPLKCESKTIFKTKNTLRVHFCRQHAQNMLNSSSDIQNQKKSDILEQDCLDNSNEVVTQLEELNGQESESLALNMFTNLYLTLETKYSLSKQSINFLVSAIFNISKLNSRYIHNNLKARGFDVNLETIEHDLFYLINNPDNGSLRSTYNREEFYKFNLNYVSSQKQVTSK